MRDIPLKPSLIFSLYVDMSHYNLLISYVNQSLMIESDGIKELDGFSFSIKEHEGLQPKEFQSVLHPIPGLMHFCIHHDTDLDYFDEGHPPNFPKRWLTDQIINFFTF